MPANTVMNGPLFALLFAAYPVLFIATSNPGQAAWSTVGAALAVSVVASALLLATMRMAFNSWNRAALGVAAIAFLFYAYGPAHTSLEGLFLDSMNETAGLALYLQQASPYLHFIMTAFWIVAGFLALRDVARMPEAWIPLAVRACNAAALVLVGLMTVQWVADRGATAASTADLRHASTTERAVSVLGYNPDIYLIVLDGYAREDVLRQHYKFDNSAFLDGLRGRGFQVSGASTANYNWTFLSLASFLNMDYLQPLLGDRISPAVRSRAGVYHPVTNKSFSQFSLQLHF